MFKLAGRHAASQLPDPPTLFVQKPGEVSFQPGCREEIALPCGVDKRP